MDKILILLLGLLAVCVAFLVFAYNQKNKLAEKKVKEKEHFEEETPDGEQYEDEEKKDGAEYFEDQEPPAGEHYEDEENKDGAEYFEDQEPPAGMGGESFEDQEPPAGMAENYEDENNRVGAEYFEDQEPPAGMGDESFEDCPPGQTWNGTSCVEGFTEYMNNVCNECPMDSECPKNGYCKPENFCGTANCFQEGFRSGNLNNSYGNPAGQEFFEGYGIESFSNGGNFSSFDEHFALERQQIEEGFENYNESVREDFDNHQPVTLKLFYADWCGHCKRFKPVFDNELPQVIQRKRLPCKLMAINADEQPELVQRYNVKGFPTMILEKNGRLIEYNGDRTVGDIEKFISKNL
jgi:thiol-disulfide isomerase/thioredoxin